MVAREILQWPSNTRNVETQREIVKTCLSWTLHIDWMGDSGIADLDLQTIQYAAGHVRPPQIFNPPTTDYLDMSTALSWHSLLVIVWELMNSLHHSIHM